MSHPNTNHNFSSRPARKNLALKQSTTTGPAHTRLLKALMPLRRV